MKKHFSMKGKKQKKFLVDKNCSRIMECKRKGEWNYNQFSYTFKSSSILITSQNQWKF